jgi:Thiamine pyrophosphate enzyme, N-terminal TPP binding domain
LDSKIKTIACRHEQNAAFLAGGIGRMTGRAGMVLVISGPGCSNLVTGLATATSEGDPLVAIGGAVSISDRLKQIHQGGRRHHWKVLPIHFTPRCVFGRVERRSMKRSQPPPLHEADEVTFDLWFGDGL